MAAASVSCSSANRASANFARSSDRVVATVNRVDLVRGRSHVVPVRPSHLVGDEADPNGATWTPSRLPEISDASGQPVPAQLRWFEAGPILPSPGRWLPPAQRWMTFDWTEVALGVHAPNPVGFWALVLDPGERRLAGPLMLDGLPIGIRWIDPPPRSTDIALATPLSASGPALERLGEKLAHESLDALRRWRVRLIAERFRERALWPGGAPMAESDPALESLARQIEDRWRSALGEATRLDRQLGADLLGTLTAVVISPDGELLPAWPLDDQENAELQDELHSTRASDADKRRTIERWLALRPTALAWVIDDGGRDLEAEGAGDRRREMMVGVSELRGRRMAASIAARGEAARSPVALFGHQSIAMPIAMPLGTAPGVAAVVRIESAALTLSVLGGSVNVEPPGLIMGPFVPQHSAASWSQGALEGLDPRFATVAQLSRGSGGGWRVYLECNTGAEPPDPDDEVRLWFGARPAPEPIVVKPGGTGHDVDLGATHWSAIIELPEGAIDPGEQLRLGFERRIPGMSRQSWPRPMLPGQIEPAKVVVDLASWASLTPPQQQSVP